MPKDIDAYLIQGPRLTVEEGEEYVDMFNLKEVFKKIDNGGKLNEFELFFAIQDTEKNRKQLEATFGRNWRNNFIRRLRLPENPDDIEQEYYGGSRPYEEGIPFDSERHVMDEGGYYYDKNDYLSAPVYSDAMYKYFPKLEFFKEIKNEHAGVILALGLDISLGYDGDSWGKQVLAVLGTIAITAFSAGTLTGPALGLLYFSAAITIFAIIFEIDVPVAIQIVLVLVSLGTAWTTMPFGKMIFEIANLALEIAKVYESMGVEKEFKELQAKEDALKEKYDAIEFHESLKFTFGSGFFHSYMKEGVHKDPYQFIYDEFNPYSVYPNTSYNRWDQQD